MLLAFAVALAALVGPAVAATPAQASEADNEVGAIASAIGAYSETCVDWGPAAPSGGSDPIGARCPFDFTIPVSPPDPVECPEASCDPGAYPTQYGIHVDMEEEATAALIAAYGDLRSQDGVTLAAAATSFSCPIYSKYWWMATRALLWEEKQDGRVFYDKGCGHVWSVQSTNPLYPRYPGWHHCDINWGIFYTVNSINCWTERRYDLSGRPISEYDTFRVYAVYKGVPFYRTHQMHANIYPSGNLYFHRS
jgi:hypothetical protein